MKINIGVNKDKKMKKIFYVVFLFILSSTLLLFPACGEKAASNTLKIGMVAFWVMHPD